MCFIFIQNKFDLAFFLRRTPKNQSFALDSKKSKLRFGLQKKQSFALDSKKSKLRFELQKTKALALDIKINIMEINYDGD